MAYYEHLKRKNAKYGKYPIRFIFQKYYNLYLEKYGNKYFDFHHEKVLNSISQCKTSALGGHSVTCNDCNATINHYNSCRDRHCPNCQSIPKLKWIDARKKDVLNTSYFHCVFTVPEELNSLFLSNQRKLYTLLFKASADTMKSLSEEEKYLGAKIGFISLLHTFGSNLSYHPHIHMILIGGGLTDALKFKPSKSDDFLFPARVIAARFRDLFLKGLESLFELNQLVLTKDNEYLLEGYAFKKFLIYLKKKNWNINIKETLHGAHNAIEYLGRYTHRIAISNNRIISVSDDAVTFKYKSYKNDGEMKIMSLHPIEFIRRFTMHILPPGFIKMRHYGILSNRSKKKTFTILKNILRDTNQKSELEDLNTREILLKIFNIDIYKCRLCGSTNLSEGPLIIKRE
jgi:hypothetical protein